jgi:hypothetical protein
LFQTGDVYGEGKLRDLGMVLKPSFKCLKNKKINLSPAILKLETLLYQNIHIYYFILYYIRRAILIQKKKWSKRKKKHAIYHGASKNKI